MSLKFQKRVEDFDCEHCKSKVKGNGYTNHCPNCLWSKHVDVNPGDRSATCLGMMKPIRVEGGSGVKGVEEYLIVHVCEKCGYEKKNRVTKLDDFNAVLDIIKKSSTQLGS